MGKPITSSQYVAKTTVSAELNKVNTIAFALSAAAIGCWAMVALFAAATANSEGPLTLLGTLASAITG